VLYDAGLVLESQAKKLFKIHRTIEILNFVGEQRGTYDCSEYNHSAVCYSSSLAKSEFKRGKKVVVKQ
jgi:hypothetical protein